VVVSLAGSTFPGERAAALPASVPRWHVSPRVDLLAYAFSWVPIVVLLLFVFDAAHPYWFVPFILTTLITDLHRHYTLPYVYLDGEVRRQYPLRFFLLPAVLLLCWTQSPALGRSEQSLSVPQVGAILAWVVLGLQLVRQDRGGREQWTRKLPCVALPFALAALCSALPLPGLDLAWVWLLGAACGSGLLYAIVAREQEASPVLDRRTSPLFPALPGAAVIAALALPGLTLVTVRDLMNALFLFFILWNGYHVILQKYGILRVYSAKSGVEAKVPGWVDRLLVWSWFPIWLVWIARAEADGVLGRLGSESGGLDAMVAPFLRFGVTHFPLLFGAAVALAAGSAGAFLAHEWRVHGLRNAPRLLFAGGTIAFYATFFALGIFPFYSAFAFTHGIEYVVFIWAFQRRRYAGGRADSPTLSRWVHNPVLFYATFTALLCGVTFYVRYAGVHVFTNRTPPAAFGESLWEWIRWYTMYQAMLHFYYDGFLWKMRKPEMRVQL
jgi:hypothetical protein